MADEFNPQGVDQTPRNNENPNSTADTGNAEPKNPFVGGDSVDAGNASDSSEQQAPVSSAALAADQQPTQAATDLGRETMAAFAVGMRETLSIRDALILSLVIDESRCPKSWLMEFAARPHLARTRTRMGELLTCAFEDEGMMPDKERCHAGIGMLLDIAEASPVPYCIQPLAVIAYTLWWLGDPRAMVFALRCLLLDEDCSLAAMIFSAADRGVAPAWCSG